MKFLSNLKIGVGAIALIFGGVSSTHAQPFFNGFSCKGIDGHSNFENDYKASFSRAQFIDISKGTGRHEHYAYFMDSLYKNMDTLLNTGSKPQTIRDVVNIIGQAYEMAYAEKGQDVKNLGVTPYLEFSSFSRLGRGNSLDFESVRDIDLAEKVKNIFSPNSDQVEYSVDSAGNMKERVTGYDSGVSINVRFQANPKNFILSQIAEGMTRYSVSNIDSSIEYLKGERVSGVHEVDFHGGRPLQALACK